ncbi:hypothetical protein C8F04DRAFT_1252159 [Mycena alexandri]|uniref:Uncharacterized protein n=1 Tax=Mycena alexandri TaxID=1745969 RepID=A0AAD6T9U9_9AGAR|nr:hypothetical protein C8F04DRAFT_1252159 [Mycena alexandri]
MFHYIQIFLSPRLTTLKLDGLDSETFADFAIFSTLAAKCPSSRNVVLPPISLPLSMVLLLLGMMHRIKTPSTTKRFTDMSLSHPVGFDLNDAAICRMATAWPQIKSLALHSFPARHLPTGVTLEGLEALPERCPGETLDNLGRDSSFQSLT